MSEHENIAALVVQTTQRFPNGVALEVDGGRTSYRDFVGLASVMAARLTHGTGASTATAIWADRSVASYVGVLAALMRGHCYVPLNPALPRERLRAMLLRTSCRNLIYDARRGPDVETLLRDLPLAIDRVAFEVGATAPTDLPRVATVEKDARAYVLFTSGSTGTPKGVPVTHANVRALLDFVRDRYTISPSDRCSQTFDLTFDLSVFDMFATWTAGACLAVPSRDDLKTPDAYIRERGLTVWFSVPSLAAFMDRAGTLTAAAFPNLRLSLFCGEALPCQLARKWSIAAPKSVVENTYGPTELTVICTFGRWTQEQTPESCELGLVPIGKPLPGMRVRVCDDELHPVEPGHVGELLMTGPQLTPGYLDDPEKTAAAYVKLPGEDAIYYRTGDRVRWKSDGEPMSFIGRRDGQIKVRGYRVELGEIENVLANYVGVSDVVVVAREEVAGEKRLIAYVVPVAGARLDVAQLRTFLGGKLPDYMVPSAFVSLDKLPLTPNGKVDRKALPAPHDRPELGTAYEAPRDETEALLAKMWSEVLRIDRVGVQDNFFGLGGDSLLAVDVLARVNDQFDLGITVAVLFENPTIRSFVTALKDPAPASSPPADQRAKPEKIDVKARYVPSEQAYFSRASFVQESMWLVANMGGGQTVLPIQIEIRGVVDKTLLEKSLNAVVARQEVLRTTLVWRDDEVAQRIHGELMVEIETVNAREQSGARRQETSDRLLRAEASRLFEIDKLPLFHATLIEFSDEDHVLQFTVLQAVWDGFSTDLLCQELYAFYQAFTRRENPTLPSLAMTFAEFSEWQRKDLEGAHLQSLLRFWTSEVDGAPRLAIPGDLNGVETEHRCGWVRFSVDASLSERIDKLSAQHGITPFMWALAAYVLLLSLRSKERDILVGAVATNRFHRNTQAIMGSFINMLPLRTTITEHDTVLKFAQGLRAKAMGVYQHQQLPIELLIRKLRQSKSTPQLNGLLDGRSEAYILAFQPPQRTLATAEGPTFVPVMSPDIGVAGMMLSIEQTPAGLSSILQYNTVRYSQSFAEGFCSSYSECLRTITDSLHNTVAEALDRLGRDCLPGLS